MQTNHGISILYSIAWRTKEYAKKVVYGDSLYSFQLLLSYCYMLERENPRMVTKVQTNEENRFEYLFMALGLCISRFRACRPAIAIDETHLKGKYKGALYVATVMDGNEQIFPIAFGLADLKNDRGWKWFLKELHNVIGSPRDFIFIFDRHISIKNAIEEVFLDDSHGLCGFHMKQNLEKKIQ